EAYFRNLVLQQWSGANVLVIDGNSTLHFTGGAFNNFNGQYPSGITSDSSAGHATLNIDLSGGGQSLSSTIRNLPFHMTVTENTEQGAKTGFGGYLETGEEIRLTRLYRIAGGTASRQYGTQPLRRILQNIRTLS